MAQGRFDVHAHFNLPDAVPRFNAADNFAAAPLTHWSPERALDFMDRYGIATQMLSVPFALAQPVARAVNSYGAQIVANYPGRFGLLASLPMGDVGATLQEIDHIYDQLGADGVIMMTNYEGTYLGDRRLEDVFAALDRRNATIFIHPTVPAGYACVACGRPGPVIEFPFDTCRSVTDMLYAGIFQRFQSIRFILSHGGGPLPLLSRRIASIGTAFYVPHPPTLTNEAVLEQLSTLYFDTAIAGSTSSIVPILELTSSDNIVFGTDFPPATESVIAENIKLLNDLNCLSFVEKEAIYLNGKKLFKRFE